MTRPHRLPTLPSFVPPHVDSLTSPPIVGHWYLVPTVTMPMKGIDLPVRGHAHTDPGSWIKHRHFDRRFLSAAMREISGPLPHEGNIFTGGSVAWNMPVTDRTWQCTASDADGFADIIWSGAPPEAVAVHRRGRIFCPHRGTDLTACPRNDDGSITCPLHGARITVP